MKRTFTLLLTILFTVSIWGADKDSLIYKAYHNEVILPQLETWQKYANRVIPEDNNNIVCIWGNNALDSIYSQIINNPKADIYEQRARLTHYQSIICCALSYPYAWMDKKIAPEAASIGFDMLKSTNQYMDSLQNINFKNSELVLKWEGNVYYDYVAFLVLNAISSEGDYTAYEGIFRSLMDATKFISQLYSTSDTNSNQQIFTYATLINNLSFYRTFESMILVTGGKEFFKDNEDIYTEAANWFDEQADRILVPLYSNQRDNIPPITPDEFLEIEKEAAQYKISIIEGLIEAADYRANEVSNNRK